MSNSFIKLLFVTLLLAILLPATSSLAWAHRTVIQQQATTTQEATTEETPPQLTTATVTSTLVLPGRAIVNSRNNHWVMDSPAALGGANQEVNPLDSFLGALATCGMFIYERAAQELNIPLEHINVVAQGDFAAQGLKDGSVNPRVRAFRVLIDMSGPSKEQADQLREQFQTRCPIYTTLSIAAPVDIVHVGMDDVVGKVLQVHFQYDITSEEYRGAATALAETFAQLEGMRWKIWTIDEETGEAGGIFLFDDDASRQGYLDGLFAEVVGSNDAFHDVVIKKFDVIEDATQVTHGPVGIEPVALSGPVGKVLQVHFQYDITSEEYRGAATAGAETFAQLEGMRWKIWTIDEEAGEAGGIFVFDDEASRQGYLDGLFAEVVASNDAFHDVVIKKFDVIEDATQVTHGPVGTTSN